MTDDSVLAALRLGDSFLPTGGNSLSYGLEKAVADGHVADGDDLRRLVETYLRRQVGPCEAVVVGAAHEATLADDPEGVAAADRRLTAVTLAPEFRESMETSGRRLLDVAGTSLDAPRVAAYADRVDSGAVPGNYPAVFGLVAAVEGVGARDAKAAFAHAFVTGQLAAAQRLLRLGHTETQSMLVDLRPVVADAIETSEARTIAELTSFTPLLDVASARHERADRRLFVS
ncbi:MAG: urease accessory protein UreF [Haloplanus sp.]